MSDGQRNLLVVMLRGHRLDARGAVGFWPISTPFLDALGHDALNLAVVSSSVADRPAMTSLYSGLHVRQHGMYDDAMEFPKVHGWLGQLREAGYFLAGAGRINPVVHHLDESCLVEDVDTLVSDQCTYLQVLANRGVLETVLEQRHQRRSNGPYVFEPTVGEAVEDDVDYFIAQRATSQIERLPRHQPWTMVVNFTGPGNDLPAPQPMLSQIPLDELKHPYVPPDLAGVERYGEIQPPRHVLQSLDHAKVRQMRAHYLGRVMLIDHAIGMIREAVDRYGHAGKTWIIVCSDRGTLLGERGLFGGRSMLSPVVWSPMSILPPAGLPRRAADAELQADDAPTDPLIDQPPGLSDAMRHLQQLFDDSDTDAPLGSDVEEAGLMAEMSDGLISSVDIAATLCAIGHVDPPKHCVGQSLLPALHGKAVGRAATVCEHANWLLLETLSHKVSFNLDTGEPGLLFDLTRDLAERTNLVDTPQAANVLDSLRWQLAEVLLPLRAVCHG